MNLLFSGCKNRHSGSPKPKSTTFKRAATIKPAARFACSMQQPKRHLSSGLEDLNVYSICSESALSVGQDRLILTRSGSGDPELQTLAPLCRARSPDLDLFANNWHVCQIFRRSQTTGVNWCYRLIGLKARAGALALQRMPFGVTVARGPVPRKARLQTAPTGGEVTVARRLMSPCPSHGFYGSRIS